MSELTFYPAIDLKEGRCVRLRQGDFQAETVYGDDPVAMARRWAGQGATWIHLINLDGAKDESEANQKVIAKVIKTVPANYQLGGGIRTLEAMAAWLDLGVARLILSTLVLENPELTTKAASRFPGRLAASLDSKGRDLKVRGWRESAGVDVIEAAKGLKALGVSLVIHTDVARDGTSDGPNLSLAAEVARSADLPTLVAGGVAGPQDLAAIKNLNAPLIVGAISGRAIYEGTLTIAQANAIFRAPTP
ncbi:MAG: 1-(5-phosphoribosyl)-5-[(5-phosphoribosylamino)methylideneamino]imidazole-4-carboxamide isomerase [Deltaproteobacteria bacterium]|nr:1-(5-phosphoribosyl)-5-[(5-phosphoribosylamino)methylideneamino]imidazole-4-carboxamide isomerase [Deltaproteobacteria bacterium]